MTTVQTPTTLTPDLLHESAAALDQICQDQACAGEIWVEDLDQLTLHLGLPGREDMEPALHELLTGAPTDLARGIAIGLSMAWLSSFALPLTLPVTH